MCRKRFHKACNLLAVSLALDASASRGSFFTSAFSPNHQHQLHALSSKQCIGPPSFGILESQSVPNKIRKQFPATHHASSTSLSASPSGIDELPQIAQAGVFFGIYVSLALATVPAIKALEVVSKSVIGLERWRENVIDTSLPLLLSLLYLTAGIGHFSNAHAFQIARQAFDFLPGRQ